MELCQLSSSYDLAIKTLPIQSSISSDLYDLDLEIRQSAENTAAVFKGSLADSCVASPCHCR